MDPGLQNVPYPPHLAGLPAYANNPLWSTYVNKYQVPSLLKPAGFKSYFGYGNQEFYGIRYLLDP